MIKRLLGVVSFFLFLLALLLAFSTGIGVLLHLVLPSVELGLCIIIVVLAIGVIINFLWNLRMPSDSDDETLPEDTKTERIYLLEPTDFRRRRKKR